MLDSLVDLPIVLPPAVAGLALLLTFGRRGLLGGPLASLGVERPFTTAAVVLAGTFVAAPFYVRAARAGFIAVPRELEEAARVEGASEWEVFRFVTAPVAAPALFGLYTLVVLLYLQLPKRARGTGIEWSGKKNVTFSDAISAVRRWLWLNWAFENHGDHQPFAKLSAATQQLVLYALAQAA